jgi:hypothetical protein
MTDEPHDSELIAEELRDLLRELGVAGRDLEAKPGEHGRAERDLAAILATPQRDARSRQSSAYSARRLGALLVAAAVLAGAFIVIRPWSGADPAYARTPAMLHLEDGGSDLLSRPGVDASPYFLELADRAANVEPAGKGAVQLIGRTSWFLSTDEKSSARSAKSVLVPSSSLQYFLPDGLVRTIDHRSAPLDVRGRVTEAIGQWSRGKPTTDETFDGPETGPDYADDLPLTLSGLKRSLIDDPAACAGIESYCISSSFMFLNYNYVLTPALKSALWRALSAESGFRYLGDTKDRVGRDAVAFSAAGADSSRRLILLADPTTGQFLGSEEILVQDSTELGLKAPAVLEFTALEASRRVSPDNLPDPSLSKRF